MYFLVNVSSPKLLDVATSNYAGAKVIRLLKALDIIWCDLDP